MDNLVFPWTQNIPDLKAVHKGKVRETAETPFLDVDGGQLLVVLATDGISTHNLVHNSRIKGKGEVLTALTIFWLEKLKKAGINTHLFKYGHRIYDYLPPGDYPEDFHHRTLIVKKLIMDLVEQIFRAYLTGSFYDKFYSKGLANPYGIDLPAGLDLMYKFPEPIYTPTDKSETDEPLDARETMEQYAEAYNVSRRVFDLVRTHLNSVGLELVDSKFEVGIDCLGRVTVGDEIGTLDSSRFADLAQITLGKNPPWLDKQLARDEAERIWAGGPKFSLTFSPEIVNQLTKTYLAIFKRITGESLEDFQRQVLN